MLGAFLNGVGFGLILAIMIGPVFFGLINLSLNKGFRQGMMYAAGVSLSDVSYILLTHFGVAALITNPSFKTGINILGGSITILFGLYYLFKPSSKKSNQPKEQTSGSNSFIKGFFLNFITPSVLLFWIGTVSLISVKYHGNKSNVFLFFAGVVGTTFTIDCLKSFVAHSIKTFISQKLLLIIDKVVGIIFIAAGSILLYQNH